MGSSRQSTLPTGRSAVDPLSRFGRRVPPLVRIENNAHCRCRVCDQSAPGRNVILEVALEFDAIVSGVGEPRGQRLDLLQRAVARPGAHADSRAAPVRPANPRAAGRATLANASQIAHSKPSYSRQWAIGSFWRGSSSSRVPMSRREMFSTTRQSWSRYNSPRPTVPSSR